MPTAEDFSHLDDLCNRLAAESIFAEAGSDEGLIPAYSILRDVLELVPDTPGFSPVLRALHTKLDELLDAASPFDEEAVQRLRTIVAWIPDAVPAIRRNEPPPPLPTAVEEPVAEAPPVEDAPGSSAADNVPADELLELNLEQNRELLTEFQSEALDHLSQIESALLVLDAEPQDADSLNALFRSFHTLKGVAGFLRLGPMNRLSHEVESLLDLARNHDLVLTPAIITEILRSRDAVADMIGQITTALAKDSLPDRVIPVREMIIKVRALAAERPQAAPQETDGEGQGAALERADKTTPNLAGPATVTRSLTSSTVRVDTAKLDSLVDVVGELVIVQSQLQESGSGLGADGSPMARNLAQLNRITKELQVTAMSLRMVPIKPTFQRMERLVRDLSRDVDKAVVFSTSGEETEIDRTVVEEIVDPLVHMVRNSLDHGLEEREERLAAGKSEAGTMRLAAYHEGSNLVIELIDDGRGIDADKVMAKARERGLVGPDEVLDTARVVELIFEPGFSTAQKVTDVSGRGVGMDVVKRNIEKLRGRIEVLTKPGEGTTFRVWLPLTTAIIDGLLVKVGEDRFILPALMVQMALRPEAAAIATVQGKGEMLQHREGVLPLHRLNRRFGIHDAVEEITDGIVIIVECPGGVYALLVDDLLNKQEVVIKNLGGFMQNMPGVAGGAILGDGTIALILDPAGLAAAA
jgi:two-component system, chemotaxis family, sensor kinase CheA